MTPSAADIRELQAFACLKAAETHHDLLLSVARRIAGSDEDGRELFNQTVLNCHDAVQRWGFNGDRYEFYLLKSLWRSYGKQSTYHQHHGPLLSEHTDTLLPDVSAPVDALGALAEQIQEELRTNPAYSVADRLAFRLHLDGESYRDIAALVGVADHSWISRRVAKMKTALRDAFGQAWANLHAE